MLTLSIILMLVSIPVGGYATFCYDMHAQGLHWQSSLLCMKHGPLLQPIAVVILFLGVILFGIAKDSFWYGAGAWLLLVFLNHQAFLYFKRNY